MEERTLAKSMLAEFYNRACAEYKAREKEESE